MTISRHTNHILIIFTLLIILTFLIAQLQTKNSMLLQTQATQNPKTSDTNENLIIESHKITSSELQQLKQMIGTWQDGTNYNQKIGTHGTGLAPPKENDWTNLEQTMLIADQISLPTTTAAPNKLDHTTDPWFPPIGNQDGKGSCVAWAVAYYTKTFQEASEHGWNVSAATWDGGYYGYPSIAYQDRIFSPDFVYNLINNGIDSGSSFSDAINLISSIGAASWKNMPYDHSDPTSWPGEDAWKEAPLYRSNSTGYQYMYIYTDEDLQSLKNWLTSGNLAIISVDADQYSALTSQDMWTLDNYISPSTNHANTIVGYDDNLTYTEQGQTRQGAFKIANSWGKGGWEKTADGCFWITYETMKQRVKQFMFYSDIINYQPKLIASFNIDHDKRNECTITLGIGDKTSPIKTLRFDKYIRGGNYPFCANDIYFDITELQNAVPTLNNQTLFLKIYDGGTSTTGTIQNLAVNQTHSTDPPVNTINNANVYASVILNSTSTLRVIPENVTLQAGNAIGKNFTIAVIAEQASNFHGFSLTFQWNITYVQCLNKTVTIPFENWTTPISPSPYAGTLHAPISKIKENLNTTNGSFAVAYNSTSPAIGFDGNGTLFTMTFTVTNQADSQVQTSLLITNSFFYDSFGATIPLETKNGKVTIPALPPDTTKPIIEILSPENNTLASNECPLTFTVNEPVSAILFSLDNQANSTTSGNTTLTNLLEGEHNIVIYANDTHGNVGKSETTFFSIDTIPPQISSITQPNETVPLGTPVQINATVIDATSGARQVLLNYTYANTTGTWNNVLNMTHINFELWQTEVPAFESDMNVTYFLMAQDNAGNNALSEDFMYAAGNPWVPESTLALILSLIVAVTPLMISLHRKKLYHNKILQS